MGGLKVYILLFLVMATHGSWASSGKLRNLITFKETAYLVEHFATSECASDQFYYNLLPKQQLEIKILSNINLNLEWCKLDDVKLEDYELFSMGNLSPASDFDAYDFSMSISIKDIGSKSGNLTCELRYENFNVFETILPTFCRAQIDIINEDEVSEPQYNFISTYIQAEVSAVLDEQRIVREVIFYDNSTVVVNCNYGEAEYAHTMKIKDRNGVRIQEVQPEFYKMGPIENLNKRFEGTEISCVETDKLTNKSYEATLKFVYNNFTFTEGKTTGKYKYENVTDNITFVTKTSLGDLISTTECINEQLSYRVLRDSVLSVDVKSNVKLESEWCKMNGLKFLPFSSSWTNHYTKQFILRIYIANVGYTSGELMCRMLYQEKGMGLCRTYISITDGVSESNDTEIINNSTLTQVLINLGDENNSLNTAELVFRENNSLAIECQFGGDEYEHSLIFKVHSSHIITEMITSSNDTLSSEVTKQHSTDNKENSIILRKSKAPFIWGPIDNLNSTHVNSQFLCVDKHKTTNVTRQTALRLMSTNHTISLTQLGKYWIILIAMATFLIILGIVMIATILWLKGRCSRQKEVQESTAPRPDSIVSTDYEYVYDVPYEERIKRDKQLEMMRQAEGGLKKPAPPPLETMPRREHIGYLAQVRKQDTKSINTKN